MVSKHFHRFLLLVFFVANSLFSQNSKINGTYVYRSSEIDLQITIRGEQWSGITKLKDIYGENADVDYQRGFVKGNTLYDESGYFQIGRVSGKSLSTNIGNGTSVTLYKK